MELPEHIAVGLNDTAQRGDWNKAAPPEFALPTETWRELIARRQPIFGEVREKLAAGEVQNVNDLITLNLDSERFARDVIVNSEGPELSAPSGAPDPCLRPGPRLRLRCLSIRRPQHPGTAVLGRVAGDARLPR